MRLFGLANKCVIIDEAHAYELFQERLLGAAVSWLADAGASVIVLSATLPTATRHALVDAWCRGHRTKPSPPGARGPLTLVNADGEVTNVPVDEASTGQHTELDLVPDPGPARLASLVLSEASSGGITAVIRNRVDSAHDLYHQARAQADQHGWRPEEIVLLHGQLLPRDRLPREELLRTALGRGNGHTRRNPARPARMLVIATQVMEQSLDLDTDRLYTDLAPIDLLIQRRGRLHRHALNDPGRPALMRDARMTVLWTPGTDGLPLVHRPTPHASGNPDAYVYAPYTLAISWHLLHGLANAPACAGCRIGKAPRRTVCFDPTRDGGFLMEAAYNPPDIPSGPMGALLSTLWKQWLDDLGDHENAAHVRALHPYGVDGGSAHIDDLKSGEAHGRGDDGAHEMAARSRLDEPATNVIVLFRQNHEGVPPVYSYDAAGERPADLADHSSQHDRHTQDAHRAQQRELLLNTIGIPANWFVHLLPVSAWPSVPHRPLRYRNVIVFDRSGRCVSGPDGPIRYTPTRGLHILHRP